MPAAARGPSVAFLLAQLGHLAAERFAERLGAIELTPPQAGILRAVAAEPGRSQQALSAQLGLLPSRVVAFVDELQSRGLLERRRNETDRRLYALHLTEAGRAVMAELAVIGKAHEDDLTAGLTRAERATLSELLSTVAERQGLVAHVHPGYRGIGRPAAGSSAASG